MRPRSNPCWRGRQRRKNYDKNQNDMTITKSDRQKFCVLGPCQLQDLRTSEFQTSSSHAGPNRGDLRQWSKCAVLGIWLKFQSNSKDSTFWPLPQVTPVWPGMTWGRLKFRRPQVLELAGPQHAKFLSVAFSDCHVILILIIILSSLSSSSTWIGPWAHRRRRGRAGNNCRSTQNDDSTLLN